MSDHVDGPRSIGEPAADLTDLFAFTSPENPARTVLAACVFPSAGESAIFSNAIEYSIVLRRTTVAGLGNAAKFQPADQEMRFTFRFGVLQRDAAGTAIQHGVCTLPEGRELALTVDDEKGASTPEADWKTIDLHSLTIDQACGTDLDAVLAARRRIAGASGRLEDLMPLGAVLADLERFAEADAVYRRAFRSDEGVSPFPRAWVCFQLGMLWGELAPVPDRSLAMYWYRRAVAYLPAYVRARVHLAEIYASLDLTRAAEALLMPALSSGDPEVPWRLAEGLVAEKRFEEADRQLEAARSGFEALLGRHLPAFADHAAEFYAGSGNDGERAVELARANLANRPTRRAQRQAHTIAAALPV